MESTYIYLKWIIRLNAKFPFITKLFNKFSSCLKFHKNIKPLNIQIFMSSAEIVGAPRMGPPFLFLSQPSCLRIRMPWIRSQAYLLELSSSTFSTTETFL